VPNAKADLAQDSNGDEYREDLNQQIKERESRLKLLLAHPRKPSPPKPEHV
jgi:hypothetical protein